MIPHDDYARILATMPVLCVDIAVIHRAECLLLKRRCQPAQGQYWFPGGRVRKGETLAAAIARKTLEETGLTGELGPFLSLEETYFERTGEMATDVHTVNACYVLLCEDISALRIDSAHDGWIWAGGPDARCHRSVNRVIQLALEALS